ncbi:hypothetical protein CEUSTIGMA_g13179.t1 [Chlamydomonas eustigma]|uniref:Uncharacterized protein n=1 Tax=Chlamydomonas eustigma TaxID=1157962 RepID=A0A250XRT5_9CHLO|nr:hypothetical protein CEUSTIGMA_g13179.t1 [Chlamydomonas eustigma]|eukprot:GAX85764.1 hypothetical protein CEUSTIGMA_g13179.t1 [Chlamydomonas eustigma]
MLKTGSVAFRVSFINFTPSQLYSLNVVAFQACNRYSGISQTREDERRASSMDSAVVPEANKNTISRFIPSWLRSLLPGGQHLTSTTRKPESNLGIPSRDVVVHKDVGITADTAMVAPEPLASASQSEKDKQRKEFVDHLTRYRDMTMDDFTELNMQVWINSEPPKPRVLNLGRNHPDQRNFVDWQRVSYLRTMQHDKICNLFTDEEKNKIKEDGKALLRDKKFLKEVEARSGVYIDLEVKDCIQGYLDTRDRMRRMYRWVVVLGEPEPVTTEQQASVLKEMEALEADEERLEKLEKQDRNNCPILPVLDFMGHDAVCKLTGLKYHQCCGGAEGRPQRLEVRDRARFEKEAGIYRRRGKFNPLSRSERQTRRGIAERQEAFKWSYDGS